MELPDDLAVTITRRCAEALLECQNAFSVILACCSEAIDAETPEEVFEFAQQMMTEALRNDSRNEGVQLAI